METQSKSTEAFTIIDANRKLVIFTLSIAVVTGCVMNFLGLVGYPEFHVPNLIYMSVVIVIALLTHFHDLNPKEACATVLIVAAIDVIGEMLFIAYMGRPDAKFQVLCECLLYTGVICIAIFAYLRIFVYLCLTAWTIAYFTCCVMLRDPVMFQTGVLIFAIFLFDTYLSVSSHWCLKNILRKNAELQNDEQEVLDFFRMDKQQLLSYIRLAHDRDLSEDETQGLLESLNVESSVTISHNVAYMMRQQEMDYEKMRMRLPDLTPSELEIARLILQEKKLNAIVKLTGKTRGNITVQRSKIRKKLRLPKNVSLYDGLRERMRSES